jgi:restriction system protein
VNPITRGVPFGRRLPLQGGPFSTPKHIYIQAKRYAAGNSVGPGAIRDFFGSLDRHKAAKGLFVTTSGFTSSARETADYLSKRIVLIDGEQLTRLMIRHNVGCRIEEVLHVKKVDEDFFE